MFDSVKSEYIYLFYIIFLYFHLQDDHVNFSDFREWLLSFPSATSMTRWLLQEQNNVTLSNDLETPTFYQTLAGVTHRKLELNQEVL